MNKEKRRIYIREWQRKKYDRIASVSDPRKVQCLICKRWYVQVGTHVIERHGYKSAREYREDFNLEVKKGTVPLWYRKMKGKIAVANLTCKNLKAGKKHRFKKGDKAGNYKRSPITLARLSKLHEFNISKRSNSLLIK